MKIFVDIDETICNNQKDLNYKKATPIKKNIDMINRLYDAGHEITYWTTIIIILDENMSGSWRPETMI